MSKLKEMKLKLVLEVWFLGRKHDSVWHIELNKQQLYSGGQAYFKTLNMLHK